MPAGIYHCVFDAIIIKPVDVQFDLIWRRGSTDTVLSTWSQHFEPNGGVNFDAQAWEYDRDAPAIDYKPGDQLVWRYSGMGTTTNEAYIPNGDGSRSKGRIPNITLPQ